MEANYGAKNIDCIDIKGDSLNNNRTRNKNCEYKYYI